MFQDLGPVQDLGLSRSHEIPRNREPWEPREPREPSEREPWDLWESQFQNIRADTQMSE